MTWCAPVDAQRPLWLLTFDDHEKSIGLYTTSVEAHDAFAQASLTWHCYLWRLETMAPVAPGKERE